MEFFEVNGIRLAVTVSGTPGGPPLILLHAGGQSRASWDPKEEWKRTEREVFAERLRTAAYALNSLLHTPNAVLPSVLAGIARVLRPGALFFLGVYGGEGAEGVAGKDQHDPPRFFSWRTDEQLRAACERHFEIEDFHVSSLCRCPCTSRPWSAGQLRHFVS